LSDTTSSFLARRKHTPEETWPPPSCFFTVFFSP
jgi:hypothetical protein